MPRIIPEHKVIEVINLPSGLDESPREIIETDFKSVGSLPISGGWGYSQDDAVIIDVCNAFSEGRRHDGYAIEKIFVEKRTYEELIVFRAEGEKFNEISWELLNQSLVHDDGRHYDVLKYKICGYLDDDWGYLKTDYEQNNGFLNDVDGMNCHQEERSRRLICFETVFWFDITSFFGKSSENNILVHNETDFKFIKKSTGDDNKYEFFNLVRLHLMPGLIRNFSESETESHKVVQISCFDGSAADNEEEIKEILSLIVADVSGDPDEPDISSLHDDEYAMSAENLRIGTLGIWGPDDFEWLPYARIKLKNDTNGLVTRFTYRDRLKRNNFALRFTHQDKQLVLMYQLNADENLKYADTLQDVIENVELL